VSIRPKIEAALSATAERLSPGSGAKAAHHAKNDLATIEASSENFGARYADEEIRLAVPVVFEAKHPEGDPVVFKKHHDGVIVVFSDSFVFVRGIGLGAREVKALRFDEVSVESVATSLDGADVPGLRVNGPSGGPKFAVAMAAGSPDAQAAVRDELVGLLTA
jgi:hypothetical protein